MGSNPTPSAKLRHTPLRLPVLQPSRRARAFVRPRQNAPKHPVRLFGLHRLRQVAGGLPHVGQLYAFLGGDDEAELVAVVSAPVEEGAAVLGVALGGITCPFSPSRLTPLRSR